MENVVFVGLANGKVGVLYVNHCADAEYKWLLNCLGAEITTIYAFQLDYVMHLLIGRLDGSIEIHALSEDNTFLILKYIYVIMICWEKIRIFLKRKLKKKFKRRKNVIEVNLRFQQYFLNFKNFYKNLNFYQIF